MAQYSVQKAPGTGSSRKTKKEMFSSFPSKNQFNEGLLRNKKKNTDLFACVLTVNDSGTVCIAAKMSCTGLKRAALLRLNKNWAFQWNERQSGL